MLILPKSLTKLKSLTTGVPVTPPQLQRKLTVYTKNGQIFKQEPYPGGVEPKPEGDLLTTTLQRQLF